MDIKTILKVIIVHLNFLLLSIIMAQANNFTIVMFGDSVGAGVARALSSTMECIKLTDETKSRTNKWNPYMPVHAYYGNFSGLQVIERDCYGCRSFRSLCKNSTAFEYLAMEHTQDMEITTRRTYNNKLCSSRPNIRGSSPCKQSITSQEFFFGEYFSEKNCPNVIYQVGTLSHDLGRRSKDEYYVSLNWMFGIIEIFIKNKCPQTHYYWAAPTRFNLKNISLDSPLLSNGNLIVEETNVVTVNFLKNRFNMYEGYSLYDYSLHLNESNYTDFIHWTGETYSQFSKMLIQNSFKKQF